MPCHKILRKIPRYFSRSAGAASLSKRIPQRECGIAAVKIRRLHRRQSKRIRRPRLAEPVIIPRHLVGEAASNIDGDGRVRPLVVVIERAGRCERVQVNGVAADKASSVTHYCGHTLEGLPDHGGMS